LSESLEPCQSANLSGKLAAVVDIDAQLWHPKYVGKCGRSSVVERYLAKVDVVSSSLIARLSEK
jgi:hypothetical protein